MDNLNKIAKKYGRKFEDTGLFIPGSEENEMKKIDIIPTGSYSVNRALGIGGIPRGRFTHLYGAEGTGKSTLALSVVRGAQELGLWPLYLDFEYALDLDYMERMGIDLKNILIMQPNTGEEGFQIVHDILDSKDESGNLGLIVIDSVASIIAKAEESGKVGDVHMGVNARLLGQINRMIAPLIHERNVALLYINQIRANMGSMYGPTETTPGGKSINYVSSIIMRIRKKELIAEKQETVGQRAEIQVKKNRLAPPFKMAEFDIIFGLGIVESVAEKMERLVNHGFIIKAGGWYKLPDGSIIGQGLENTYASNVELLEGMLRELEAL